MPKIFSVHVCKTVEADFEIVAEDEKELRAALREAIENGDIEDWFDNGPDDWETSVVDPVEFELRLHRGDPEAIPLKVEAADMGVVNGEILHIHDYKSVRPNYIQEIEEGRRRYRLRLYTDRTNLKLPL